MINRQRKQFNYEDYLDNLTDSGRRYVLASLDRKKEETMSYIECHEMAGWLLKRDLTSKFQDIGNIMVEICEHGGFHLGDLMAAYCCENSTDNAEELLIQVRKALINHYEAEIQQLLDEHWHEIDVTKKEQAGLKRRTYADNGEQYWSKY